MRDKLFSLANEIRQNQAVLREKVRELRFNNPQFTHKVQRIQLSFSVCAVDGGLLAHRLHGYDIVIGRTVGVSFIYESSILKSFDYYPEKYPNTSIELRSGLDEHEANVFRALFRLKQELECALKIVGKHSPNMLLMDGSLLPLPSDKPGDGSELAPLYSEVLTLYERLYALCEQKKCQLCGVIKDSRSKKLSKGLGLNCSDTVLCSHLLNEGERTSDFSYFDETTHHADFTKRIKVFYLRPSEHDLPLRIEMLQSVQDVDRVASVLCTLSAISDNFAYPAILIEADMRAALDSKELSSINSLIDMDIKPLRRNSRPFR